jgi:hypothetical protein
MNLAMTVHENTPAPPVQAGSISAHESDHGHASGVPQWGDAPTKESCLRTEAEVRQGVSGDRNGVEPFRTFGSASPPTPGACEGSKPVDCTDTAQTRQSFELDAQAEAIQAMVAECHGRAFNAGWYDNPLTGQPIERNVGELLALVHSEVSEALEGHRKNLNDAHLPHRKMIEVELADTLIRIFDLAGYMKLDVGGAYHEKLLYNETRADHKAEVRAAGGKAF